MFEYWSVIYLSQTHIDVCNRLLSCINVKKLQSLKYSLRAQKSHRENSKIILGLNPYDICTGALT